MTAVPTTPAPPPKPPSRPNNWIGVAILALFLILAGELWRGAGGATTFGFVMLGWTLSVMAHEFGHAVTGYMAGDHTVVAKGYLSFDPRRYADLGVSLVLPLLFLALGGIGFPGGAVYLRDDLMRSRLWRAAASLAGPFFTGLVLLLLAACIGLAGDHPQLRAAIAFLAFLQATALVLNLIPIPGFDGFGVLQPFLPIAWRPAVKRIAGLAAVGFLVLIFIVPGGAEPIFRVGEAVAQAVGVPLDAVAEGFGDFRFWLKR